MPTKIVATGSDPENALIDENDLAKITDDFQGFCAIMCTDTSRPVFKTSAISIPIKSMWQLIEPYISEPPNCNVQEIFNNLPNVYVKIKFGITLPGQLDCETATLDISNRLTVATFIESGGIEMNYAAGENEPDNYVLTSGFRGFLKDANLSNDNPCCPHEP